MALIGGFVLECFRLERWVEDWVWKSHMGEAAQIEEDTSLRARYDYAVAQVKAIVGRICKFILIGVRSGVGVVPALSLPEIINLKNLVKVPLLALLTAYLSIAFVIVSLLFNLLKGVLWVPTCIRDGYQ